MQWLQLHPEPLVVQQTNKVSTHLQAENLFLVSRFSACKFAVLYADKIWSLSQSYCEIILPGHRIKQHDHRVYIMILFYKRDTSFLFHSWERPVCTSQLHETRLAKDGGREPVWKLLITRLLIEAERLTTNELVPSNVWFSINLLLETLSRTSLIPILLTGKHAGCHDSLHKTLHSIFSKVVLLSESNS